MKSRPQKALGSAGYEGEVKVAEMDKAVSVQNVISNHQNVTLQDKYFRGDSPKIQSLMVPIKPLKNKKA